MLPPGLQSTTAFGTPLARVGVAVLPPPCWVRLFVQLRGSRKPQELLSQPSLICLASFRDPPYSEERRIRSLSNKTEQSLCVFQLAPEARCSDFQSERTVSFGYVLCSVAPTPFEGRNTTHTLVFSPSRGFTLSSGSCAFQHATLRHAKCPCGATRSDCFATV